MQYNKHGIPVVKTIGKRVNKPVKTKNLTQKSGKVAEFTGNLYGCEIKIIVPNDRALVQAYKNDGWKLKKYSRGEIA